MVLELPHGVDASSCCVSGSSYDRQRRSDPSHADSEGGAEAHPRVPAPAVRHSFITQTFAFGTLPVIFFILRLIFLSGQVHTLIGYLFFFILFSPAAFCCLTLWFRSFCSCLIEPVARSPELQELVQVNLEFQVQLIKLFSTMGDNILNYHHFS